MRGVSHGVAMSAFRHVVVALSFLAISACSVAQNASANDALGYVSPAEAGASFESAKQQASVSGKRILVIAGGDWCRWCHVLDRFLHSQPELEQRLDAGFVVLKLAVGDGSQENPALDALPRAIGYPHFWILGADGALIDSVETSHLERGRNDYSAKRFSAFLDRYSPKHH